VKTDWLREKAGVLAEREFRLFYTGYVTSLLGTSMSSIALTWAVFDSHLGTSALGLVMFASVIPMVLLMAVAGAIADRFGRRRVMLSADVLRCCAQTLLAVLLLPPHVFPLAPFAGHPPLWAFVVLASLRGTGDAFFTPALQGLTVEMAPQAQLANANTLYGLARSATTIAGPSLAGVLVAVTGPAAVIGADAATYAVSVVVLSLLRIPPADRGGPAGANRGTLFGDIAEGWSDFRSRTWLWVVTVQWAFLNLITWAPFMLLGQAMAHEYLGGPAVWGAIMGVEGAGAILAGLLLLGRRPRRPMIVATVATFCYALPDIPLALHASAPWVALTAFILGLGSAPSNTYFSTAIQQQVPADKLARVNSLITFPNYGIGVIGYAIDGPLASVFGAQAVFGVGAVYGLISTAFVLSLRSIRGVGWQPADRDLTPAQGEPAAAAGTERGEGGHPSGHRDDHRDREPLPDVLRRNQRHDGESNSYSAERQAERPGDPAFEQRPAQQRARLAGKPQQRPGHARQGRRAEHGEADDEGQLGQVGDRRNPDQ
jgi:MFS family permease